MFDYISYISTIQRTILAGSIISVSPPAFLIFFPGSLPLVVDFFFPNWNGFLQFINCKLDSLNNKLLIKIIKVPILSTSSESFRCGEETAMTTLASVTSTTPSLCWIAIL